MYYIKNKRICRYFRNKLANDLISKELYRKFDYES